jgi:hypothetical protein
MSDLSFSEEDDGHIESGNSSMHCWQCPIVNVVPGALRQARMLVLECYKNISLPSRPAQTEGEHQLSVVCQAQGKAELPRSAYTAQTVAF